VGSSISSDAERGGRLYHLRPLGGIVGRVAHIGAKSLEFRGRFTIPGEIDQAAYFIPMRSVEVFGIMRPPTPTMVARSTFSLHARIPEHRDTLTTKTHTVA